VILRLGDELGAARRPLRVGGADVSHPDVEKCAGPVEVARGRQRDRRPVAGRATKLVFIEMMLTRC
jgi:hypothetical protein